MLHPADQVLEERIRNNRREFLVRWTGFTARHDSWTPKITPCLQRMWEKSKRHRRWTKLIPATSILQVRGKSRWREYLVKFRGIQEPEWTPFATHCLIKTWENKRCKGRRFKLV